MSRIEHDLLGEMEIQDGALWGIHAERARRNFPQTGRKNARSFISAFAAVKEAAALANKDVGSISSEHAEALIAACRELQSGELDSHIVVDALSGGAGTSMNMNINEVLANRANIILGGQAGQYAPIHPLDTVNLHQSTNDAYPTALRIAALWELDALEKSIIHLQSMLQQKEHEFSDVVMVGRTQLQDAVPMTAGQLFGTYAEAFARDRWRVFKCVERIKIINMGGTAIGTGIGAPRKYIFKVVEHLRNLSGLPLGRAENPVEATANQDAIVEIDGIMSALASNIIKLANDLRILSTPSIGEFELPPMQAGSSIMPGKINPVIPEYAAQLAIEVIGGHNTLTHAVSQGTLQLSQYFPLAAWRLLDNLQLMQKAVETLAMRCICGLKVNSAMCMKHLENSMSIAAALIPDIGYEKAQSAVLKAKEQNILLKEALMEIGVDSQIIEQALSPSRLRKLGSD